MLNRSRGFALAAVLVTALGVGANTATFSVADFVLVRPLPFREPDALVRLCEGPRTGRGWGCMNEMSCLATAVLGSLRPAMRAARVDPMSALRAD